MLKNEACENIIPANSRFFDGYFSTTERINPEIFKQVLMEHREWPKETKGETVFLCFGDGEYGQNGPRFPSERHYILHVLPLSKKNFVGARKMSDAACSLSALSGGEADDITPCSGFIGLVEYGNGDVLVSASEYIPGIRFDIAIKNGAKFGNKALKSLCLFYARIKKEGMFIKASASDFILSNDGEYIVLVRFSTLSCWRQSHAKNLAEILCFCITKEYPKTLENVSIPISYQPTLLARILHSAICKDEILIE